MAVIVPCTDKFNIPLANLTLTQSNLNVISAAVAAAPGRLNPWYMVTLTVLGVPRQAGVRVVSGQPVEVHYTD